MCPQASKYIHQPPASISMFDYCNLHFQSPYSVWATLHASSNCIPGSTNKSSWFPLGFKFMLGAAQSMRPSSTLSLLRAGRIGLNRIYLSSATNQHLKHVKERPQRHLCVKCRVHGAAENKRRPCVSTVVMRLTWSEANVVQLKSCQHVTIRASVMVWPHPMPLKWEPSVRGEVTHEICKRGLFCFLNKKNCWTCLRAYTMAADNNS